MTKTTYKVKRDWYNQFAQHGFELEDGTQVFINYGNDEIEVVKP